MSKKPTTATKTKTKKSTKARKTSTASVSRKTSAAKSTKAVKVVKQEKATVTKSKLQKPRVISSDFLFKLNILSAIAHLGQAILIVVLAKASSHPVTTSYLTSDPLASKGANAQVLAPATQHLFDINLVYVVAAFMVLPAFVHALIATRYRTRYEADLQRGLNKLRWAEYALSNGLILIAISLLAGVFDASTLFLIFVSSMLLNLFAFVMELRNQERGGVRKLSQLIAFIASIAPWLVLALYVVSTNVYGSANLSGAVYGILITALVGCKLTALNMYLGSRGKGRWADYRFVEVVYVVLGALTKTALTWQIFAAVLR